MIYDKLCEVAGRVPATSGLRLGDHFSSYAQVAERAGRMATGFIERGLTPATPVGMLMTNGPELLTIAYAVFAAGGIVVPLNPLAPRAELARTARKAHVAAVVASAPNAEVANNLIADLAGAGQLPRFISGGPEDSIAELERSPLGHLPTIPADHPALYMFSSGSTGLPKVVPHTHGELVLDATGCAAVIGYSPDDTMINMMPSSHAMGFIIAATQVAFAGASTLYWSDPQPFMLSKGRYAQTISDNKNVTIALGVPFVFDALSTLKDDVDFSRLRLVQSSGIALRREIYDRFKSRFDIPLRQMYGSTECLFMSFNNAANPDESWDSVGQISPDIKMEVEPSDNPFGPEFGEIVVTSKSVTKGYLDAPETNAKSLHGGRFFTGDLGTIDAKGDVYLKGRSKLIIEVAGHKVDPFEIEEVLIGHPSVAEAVVVGIPDPRTGEQRLKAVIVPSADETPDAIIRYCRQRLESQKVPNVVEFRTELPRSATGKILRGKLMEIA